MPGKLLTVPNQSALLCRFGVGKTWQEFIIVSKRIIQQTAVATVGTEHGHVKMRVQLQGMWRAVDSQPCERTPTEPGSWALEDLVKQEV